MPPEDRVRLLHMIEATETALGFVASRERADLDADAMLRFALVRAIEIIGEAAGRVSAETRTAAPHLPWNLLVAMRNRLIHAYFATDHDILWRTATEELPTLLPTLRALLPAT